MVEKCNLDRRSLRKKEDLKEIDELIERGSHYLVETPNGDYAVKSYGDSGYNGRTFRIPKKCRR